MVKPFDANNVKTVLEQKVYFLFLKFFSNFTMESLSANVNDVVYILNTISKENNVCNNKVEDSIFSSEIVHFLPAQSLATHPQGITIFPQKKST